MCDHKKQEPTCCDFNAHVFTVVTKTWETVNYARYQILKHSAQRLVCSKCTLVIDPFEITERLPPVHFSENA